MNEDKRKRIANFITSADEKALNRLIDVIEDIENPVFGYTHTGDPVSKEEVIDFLNREKGVLPKEEYERRMAILNPKKKTDVKTII
jgi:hypothetical protein